MKIFSNLSQDLYRYSKGSVLVAFKIILISHAFHLVVLYRLGCSLRKLPIIGGFCGLIVEYIIRIIYASDISCSSKIGPGLFILHGHDIVIGSGVIIGSECKIMNGVSFGNKETESGVPNYPLVGNNCIFGTGSKILGNIKLEDNIVVGANAVVIDSFPQAAVLIGVPARMLS